MEKWLRNSLWPILIGASILGLASPTQGASDQSIKNNMPAIVQTDTTEVEESLEEKVEEEILIAVYAKNQDVKEVLMYAAKETGENVALDGNVEGNVNFYLKNLSFEEILKISSGLTGLNWIKKDNIYFVSKQIEEVQEETQVEQKQMMYFPQNYDSIVSPYSWTLDSMRQSEEMIRETARVMDMMTWSHKGDRFFPQNWGNYSRFMGY